MTTTKSFVSSFSRRVLFWDANQTFAALVALLVLVTASIVTAGPLPPIYASANNHYLVDGNGNPFLMTGDSAWSFMQNLDYSDASLFLHSRATNGFNTILASLVCVAYTGGRSDASMLDGTKPFTNSINGQFDLASVNPAYFLEISNYVQMANTNGLLVLLAPLETGGFEACALTNGPAKCLAYGQYVGNFFKSFTNVLWISGNDYGPGVGFVNDAVITNVAYGIQLVVSTNQAQTVELGVPETGLEDGYWYYPLIQFAWGYSYNPTYDIMYQAYNLNLAAHVGPPTPGTLPEVFGEGYYENEGNAFETGTPLVLRKQEWWTMTSGGAGQFYGNHYTWTFVSGWQGQLTTEATAELNYWEQFLKAHQWWNLVPDVSHAVLTAGYGAYATSGLITTNDYVTAAWVPNGTLLVAYLPSNNSVTVNMAKFAGTVAAQWFDPTTGNYSTVSGSPFANTGTQTFTPSGSNTAGGPDWVLALETAPVIVAPQIIAVTFSNSDFVIRFSTTSGQTYELQSTTNLASGPWLPIVTNLPGTGSSIKISDTNASSQSQRYFRVKSGM